MISDSPHCPDLSTWHLREERPGRYLAIKGPVAVRITLTDGESCFEMISGSLSGALAVELLEVTPLLLAFEDAQQAA